MSRGLTYAPYAGQIIMCRFDGNLVPEMVKTRPVVVVTPRHLTQKKNTVTVVPLSTTAPRIIEPYHIQIQLPEPLPADLMRECWAKCDMVYTVGLHRLNLIRMSRDENGRRVYYNKTIDKQPLNTIRKAIYHAIGGPHLPSNLI